MLEGVQLQADSAVEFAKLTPEPGVSVLVLSLRPLALRARLSLELVSTHPTEDPFGEELLDEPKHTVLSQIERLPVLRDLGGSLVDVASRVVAAVVAVVLARARKWRADRVPTST